MGQEKIGAPDMNGSNTQSDIFCAQYVALVPQKLDPNPPFKLMIYMAHSYPANIGISAG